jgi:hypothetical protein
LTTKSRAQALERELGQMRGQRVHEYRRPRDGGRLVLGAAAVLDTFFQVIGGGRAPLSERARRFLAEVPVGQRMSDAEAYPVLVARGDVAEGDE